MKELMLGNKALARGLYEAGCKVISSYPGTPSTEIAEEAALYDEIECGSRPIVHDLLSGIKCRSGCLRGR